jgi:hypothetical protein
MNNHEAGFAKLGYLYQIRYALYQALEDSGAYFIKLESLDDVELETSVGTSLFQLKHHYKESNLPNKSVDFWKSIGIWAEQIKSQDINTEEFKFFLVTTSNIQEKTIASQLLKHKRNEEKAVELMNKTASEIGNKALTNSIDNFCKLTQAERLSLCKSITVLPQGENASAIAEKIKGRLELSVRYEFVDDLYERLEGWWFSRVVEQLFGNSSGIWREEVRDKVLAISYDYHPENLPIDFNEVSLEQEQIESYMGYQFVQQLEFVGVNPQRIHRAVLDFYKAYNQRTKWVRDDLLLDLDLEKYEAQLVEEWDINRQIILDELGDDGEAELQKAGRKVLSWMESKADIRIKPRVAEKSIMRGSYHMLSDLTPPPIGWHPNFDEKLNQLIGIGESNEH